MTPVTVTDALIHQLTASSHAEGVIDLAVACTVDLDGRVLLIIHPDPDPIDTTWQLPTGPVLPGDTLVDALAIVLATVGLDINEITGYLGHDDRVDTDGQISRMFFFAVTVTDPHSICRSARIGHSWADLEDLPHVPAPPDLCSTILTATAPVSRHEPQDPPLAQPLRASARGLSATEAGTELFIRHATWPHRSDFQDQFVHLNTNLADDTQTAAIDWPAAIAALDTCQLPCSSGEARILRLAASLVDGIPVDLRDALIGLDSRNLDLISQAVVHAAGRRQPFTY
jgi:8-oxo-dGTP diphosphatase